MAGFYGFGQHDDELVGLIANDGSGGLCSSKRRCHRADRVGVSGRPVQSVFVADVDWRRAANPFWRIDLGECGRSKAGSRARRFLTYTGCCEAFGASIIRRRRSLQVSGPLLDYAVSQGLGFIPLRGERDQEHQFGLTIPLKGWSFDVNNYHQRARNYFDHDAIGNSNIFFPLTVDQARLYGWEVAVRSPQLFHRGEVYLAYAYAHAEGAGAVSGGIDRFRAARQWIFPAGPRSAPHFPYRL